MSFDLYFCAPRDYSVDLSRICQCFSRIEHISENRTDDGTLVQFEYHHPDTGAYCFFDFLNADDHMADGRWNLPKTLNPPALVASVNLLRPYFFALETMPIISAIATDLGFHLFDAQEEIVYAPGTGPAILTANWTKHNDQATIRMAQDAEDPIRKPFLSRKSSRYWWEYTRARASYQESFHQDVFVPSILLMAEGEEVKTTVVWSAEVDEQARPNELTPLAQIFPKCDYFLLAWGSDNKPFTKAIVPYVEAITAMGNSLEPLDGPVDNLLVLWPNKQRESAEIFRRLPKRDLGGLTHISADGFSDVVLLDK